MKKVRMGLMALAAICSISVAFAFSPKANKTLNTYYAVSTGSTSWTWVDTPPDHKKCSDFSTNQVSCSAEASSLPADNTMPAGQPIDHQAYQ
jgi:hypothetical protein